MGKSITERILDTDAYQTYQPFSPKQMGDILGVERATARNSIETLLGRLKLVQNNDGLYQRRKPRHWIHKAPLNDAVRMCEARLCWVGA